MKRHLGIENGFVIYFKTGKKRSADRLGSSLGAIKIRLKKQVGRDLLRMEMMNVLS